MKRTAVALVGAAVVIGGGTLVMSQALAAPASQSQRIDGPQVDNSPAGAATEDRTTPASTRTPGTTAPTHDANDDRVNPGATHVEPGDDHGRRHGGHGADDGANHDAGEDHGGDRGHD